MAEFAGLDLDRESIVNALITGAQATVYAADDESVNRYGIRQATLSGGGLLDDPNLLTIAGVALTRKKVPRMRPTMTVRNRLPSQLQRECNEVIAVNYPRALLAGARFNIQSFATRVVLAGNLWETVYQLEEQP